MSPPRLFQPAIIAMTFTAASTTAAIAPTVTAVGRSPRASGLSAARAASFFARLRA